MNIYDTLSSLQANRKFYIKSVNRQVLSTKSLIRRSLKWSPALPEAEREAINKKANDIYAAVNKGTTCEGVSESVIEAIKTSALSMSSLVKSREDVEKAMKSLVRQVPTYDFIKGVKGFGELGAAVLYAETGDLSNYSGPAKVWKRLGLAPYKGKAGSHLGSKDGMTKEDWVELGYSPHRRSEVHSCITDPLFRAQHSTKVGIGHYGEVYDRRRAKTEAERPEWNASKAHHHMDAARIMTKELVKDLWREHHMRAAAT